MKKTILVLALFASTASGTTFPNEYVRNEVYKVAKKNNFSPWVLLGLASRETDFRHSLVGDKGESFTMFQIHRGFHPEFSGETSETISIVSAGDWVVKELRQSLKALGSINAAIASYNGGRGGVGRAIRKHGPQAYDRATTGGDYSKDVLARARLFAEKFGQEY